MFILQFAVCSLAIPQHSQLPPPPHILSPHPPPQKCCKSKNKWMQYVIILVQDYNL